MSMNGFSGDLLPDIINNNLIIFNMHVIGKQTLNTFSICRYVVK